MSESKTTMQTQEGQPNFDDTNFLQDWLERRYGCGFAQMVMDDVERATLQKTEVVNAPYDVCEEDAVNDNFIPRYKKLSGD